MKTCTCIIYQVTSIKVYINGGMNLWDLSPYLTDEHLHQHSLFRVTAAHTYSI